MVEPETLKSDLRKVAEKLGHAPTVSEYVEHGNHSPRSIYQFVVPGEYDTTDTDKWQIALKRAGVDADYQERRGRDKKPGHVLLQNVVEVAEELGRTPSRTDYRQHGDHSPATLARRFGTKWADILEAAGFDPDDVEAKRGPKGATEESVRNDLKRVLAQEGGEYVTTTTYNAMGEYTSKTVKDHLGADTWAEAVEEV